VRTSFFLLLGFVLLSGCQEESSTQNVNAETQTQQVESPIDVSEIVSVEIKLSVAKQVGKTFATDVNDKDFQKLREFTILTDDPTLETAIKAMPNLEFLNIEVPLRDISFLESLINLEQLRIVENSIEGLDFSALTQLQYLSILDSNFKNASSLRSLKNLTYLDINNSKLQDITALKELTSLTSLNISENNVLSLEPIKELKALRTLDISYNSFEDTKQLEAFVQLTHLQLNGNPITSYSFVNFLPNLEMLRLRDTNVSDLSFLEHAVSLRTLDIRETDVTSIHPLIQLPQLSYLFLNKEVVKDWILLKDKEGMTISESSIAE